MPMQLNEERIHTNTHKWYWDNWISILKKTRLDSKWKAIKVNYRPKRRAKTIKLLEENTGINICDLGLGTLSVPLWARRSSKKGGFWSNSHIIGMAATALDLQKCLRGAPRSGKATVRDGEAPFTKPPSSSPSRGRQKKRKCGEDESDKFPFPSQNQMLQQWLQISHR